MPLPVLPGLPKLTQLEAPDFGFGGGFIGVPGGGSGGSGGGIFGGGGSGGLTIGVPLPGSGGSGGSGSSASGRTSATASTSNSFLSSLLGIPAINWGRIAAFLLGLLLIAAGLYLIRPVNQIVTQTVRATKRTATDAAVAA